MKKIYFKYEVMEGGLNHPRGFYKRELQAKATVLSTDGCGNVTAEYNINGNNERRVFKKGSFDYEPYRIPFN